MPPAAEKPEHVLADLRSAVDANAATPLYRQVTDLIYDAIRAGRLRRGDVLPPLRELGPLLGVSEITVRRAIQELSREGLLLSRPGSGTLIANVRPVTASFDDLGQPAADAEPLVHLGLVMGSSAEGSPYLARSIQGIRDVAAESMMLRFFEQPAIGDAAATARFAETVPLGELAGVLMYSPVNLELIVRCRRADVPVVLLWNDAADGLTPAVQADFAAGACQAVAHLVERGCRRVAMVTHDPRRSTTSRWIAGFGLALQVHHLDPRHCPVVTRSSYSEDDGYQATALLLDADDHPKPDAILFASDQQATGGLRACHERGLSVPDDVAIIGCGDAPGSQDGDVPLTTIDLRADEIGRRAMATLREQMTHQPQAPLYQTLTPRLVVRQSA